MKILTKIFVVLSVVLCTAILSLQINNSLEAKPTLPRLKMGDPLPANLFIELAKIVNPAVVNINTTQLPHQKMPQFYRDPFFDLFGPFMFPQQSRPQQSLGTGFIIREDGLILTNNHVIDKADMIRVQINEDDSELFDAEVVGKDARTDIALIKIKAKKPLATVTLGSSKDIQVGEWVAAFGNPFGHGHSVTKGIISAIGREIGELNRFPFLQTDASINPGNSGGPLVNTLGEVVGVNTAIDARAQGIGFAIPIDSVKSILKTLEEDGRIKRGFLGVVLADINDPRIAESLNLTTTDGALIEHVYDHSPADVAGIKPYDFIIKFNDKEITSSQDLIRSIADQPVGTKVKIQLVRNQHKKTVTVTLKEHPDEVKNRPSQRVKKYYGQKAPFDLGFKISDYSKKLAKDFDLAPINKNHPVVIEVATGSPASKAGLNPGDIILEINKKSVRSAKDVLKTLQAKFNILRVLRQDRAMLIYLRSY